MRSARHQPTAAGPRAKRGGGGGWLHGVALLLTALAGFVDAVGYLLLAHVFVANMSGNSVAVGLDTADARWRVVVHRGYPIVCFVAGLLIGGALAEGARRRRGSGVKLGWVLLVEAVMLAAFLAYACKALGWRGRPGPMSTPHELVLVTLAAVAMGVQNVSLRASGALGVYTTHVTGSLTQLADEAVRYGYWVLDRLRRRRGFDVPRWRRIVLTSPRHPSFAEMVFLAGIWCAFVVGAAAGALGLRWWGVAAMTAPPVVLALLAVVELTSGRTATRIPASDGRRDPRSLNHGNET